jgi:uncharacterized protein YjeT (DUF2065 family)
VRVTLQVQGEEISGYRILIHVPEDWRRRQTQTTLGATLRTIGFGIFAAAFVIALLVAFFRSLKTPEVAGVPWKRLARWSLVVLGAALATYATSLPQYLANYRTDLPFRTFVGSMLIAFSLGAALFYTATIFLFGLAWVFLARAYGAQRLPVWRGLPPGYYRDALVAGLCGSAVLIGMQRLQDLAARVWPVPRFAFPASVPEGLDANWPALHAIAGALTRGLIGIGILALALGFAACYVRRAGSQAILLAILTVLMAPRAGSAGDFVQGAAITFIELGIIWWGAQSILRFNLLGYVLVALLVSFAGSASALLRQPNALFRAHGWAVIAAGAVLLLGTAVEWRRASGRSTQAGAPEQSIV